MSDNKDDYIQKIIESSIGSMMEIRISTKTAQRILQY